MPTEKPENSDDLLEGVVPEVKPLPPPVRPDISEPWYRPAKQFLRREQWNAGILELLKEIPGYRSPEGQTLRYVGLPGRHHLDVLSMRKFCLDRKVRIDYLGFRSGGAKAQVIRLDELHVLSNNRVHTPNSITVPDIVENLGAKNSLAARTFAERGPFDVINLDVCGGVLHGEGTPLLKAIRHVLSRQALQTRPWLLYVTTMASAEDIKGGVIGKFFSSLTTNCDKVASFKGELEAAAGRCGLTLDEALRDPATVQQTSFLKLFTLAFGKWLLANLDCTSPPSDIVMRPGFWFRNTGFGEPEMLSLAYLISPVIGGSHDPVGVLPTKAPPSAQERYTAAAVRLVSPSMDGVKDLDEVWCAESETKQRIIAECEELLRLIGVDGDWLSEWRKRHGLDAT
jgi:hypothetical protein